MDHGTKMDDLKSYKGSPPTPIKPTRKYLLPMIAISAALLFENASIFNGFLVIGSIIYFFILRHGELRSYSFNRLKLGYYTSNKWLMYAQRNKRHLPKKYENDEERREWEELANTEIFEKHIQDIEKKYLLLKMKPYRNQVYDEDIAAFEK
jgi:hypothetical protein